MFKNIKDKNKKLLFSITKKDFKVDWFSGQGAGGQNRNKTKNCCRLTHIDTGIIKVGQNERCREKNKKDAFLAIINDKKFKQWLRIKVAIVNGEWSHVEKEINNQIDEWMDEKYMKIEYGDKF
jgi:peptide chain release factor 1